MADQPISTLKQNGNRNEKLVCRVLSLNRDVPEKNGIKTINGIKQFITENRGWFSLIFRFKGMGPAKVDALKEMIRRSGLEK